MSQAGCYHDLTHRMPFGEVATRVLAKLMVPQGAMGEIFYRRHCHHHAKTGEIDDPKMRRYWTCSNNRYERLITIFFPIYGVFAELYHQQHAAKKFASKIKIDKRILGAERALQYGTFAYIFYTWGFAGGFGRILMFAMGMAELNQIRMLTEHAGQDLANPYNQATFYESGLFLRLAFFGVPQGDLHHVHHTYPKCPNYKNIFWGHQMNPVIEKLGVKKYTSFFGLLKDYYWNYKPYGKEWHPTTETKKEN